MGWLGLLKHNQRYRGEAAVQPESSWLMARGRISPRSMLAIGCKVAVTIGCFWYLSQQIDSTDMLRSAGLIDFAWAGLSVLMLVLQVPLVGLRWSRISDALEPKVALISPLHMVAITSIGLFFAQIVPYLVGDTVRAWMLTRLGRDWRNAVISVLMDRAVGVAALLVLAFIILLLPSALPALGGHRTGLLAAFAIALLAGLVSVAFAPLAEPLLKRWRLTRWISEFAVATHDVLLRSSAGGSIVGLALVIHVLTIFSVWFLGRADGLPLTFLHAAVLFAVMVAVAVVPITIGGWGLREVAVATLLQADGVPPDKAVFFSVSFGLAMIAASLPGGLVWALYSPETRPLARRADHE